jgi:calcineurin-like phosphoesterase family protein
LFLPTSWFISDTHFGHQKVCTVFTKKDGSPLRPFSCAEEMDEFMIKAWNERVRPKDKVYHLGDVVIHRKFLHILDKLNGSKVLIRGNHDIFKMEEYARYFRDIRAFDVKNGMILSHVPVHPESLARFGCNIHGHLHANRVMKIKGVNTKTDELEYSDVVDPRYFNVSVEQIDFAPISLEEVNDRIIKQGGHIGFNNENTPVM